MVKMINKIILTAALSIAAVFASVANPDSQVQKGSSGNIPIIIKEPKDNHHRSLTPTVEAYYQNGTIYMIFHKYLGYAFINICNTNTGEQVEQMCDTGLETISIDVSNMGTGEYYIIIYTENDSIFTGEFEI